MNVLTLNGKVVVVDGESALYTSNSTPPFGKKTILSTTEVDVSDYATAQVVDDNLISENIKEGISVLGVRGTYGSAPVIDNLESTSTTSALSANQGRVLNEKIEDLKQVMGIFIVSGTEPVEESLPVPINNVIWIDISEGNFIPKIYVTDGWQPLHSSYC